MACLGPQVDFSGLLKLQKNHHWAKLLRKDSKFSHWRFAVISVSCRTTGYYRVGVQIYEQPTPPKPNHDSSWFLVDICNPINEWGASIHATQPINQSKLNPIYNSFHHDPNLSPFSNFLVFAFNFQVWFWVDVDKTTSK